MSLVALVVTAKGKGSKREEQDLGDESWAPSSRRHKIS